MKYINQNLWLQCIWFLSYRLQLDIIAIHCVLLMVWNILILIRVLVLALRLMQLRWLVYPSILCPLPILFLTLPSTLALCIRFLLVGVVILGMSRLIRFSCWSILKHFLITLKTQGRTTSLHAVVCWVRYNSFINCALQRHKIFNFSILKHSLSHKNLQNYNNKKRGKFNTCRPHLYYIIWRWTTWFRFYI